ncbi:hypothetical protein COCMIDRAFT_31108 [Bipolaris oryzae ATCC 44560]|uniref:Rhodopsin domain-containing protein n=1 Tax=Bipolaris oryzae ATCC 44560 TaxID=930090 RepID=W6YKV1_COCMI|nr:uncharacterized protein COCMIDRAFT_31108 [Bipolaris oryzae ATCC 44560]EUC39822.1 hypothetical protein COCMIDRAFT_31108 [Bipolaris oryzae ATCC 44560]
MAIDQTSAIVIEWCLYVTSIILAGCRFGVHIRNKTTSMVVADLWLVLAVLNCTALIACDTATYKVNEMNNFISPSEYVRKLRYATMYLFDGGLFIPKFSMLAFYIRIIPATSPKMRKGLWAVVFFVTASAIAAYVAITFWCGTDLAINWSDKPGACSAFSAKPLGQLTWSLNIISEIFIFLLPLPIIRSLNFRYRREKAGLLCMFMLGSLTITSSIVRFAVQDLVVNNLPMYILAMAEYTISIMIISCLSLRPLLRKIHRIATDSGQGSSRTPPFSRSAKFFHRSNAEHHGGITSGQLSSTWRKSRPKGPVYIEGAIAENGYGSQVELTELQTERIYKAGEVIATSERDNLSVSDNERSSVKVLVIHNPTANC